MDTSQPGRSDSLARSGFTPQCRGSKLAASSALSGCRGVPSGGCAGAAPPARTTPARAEHRRHDDEQPQGPGEVPEHEAELDVVRVLDDEDAEEPDASDRGDRTPAESTRVTSAVTRTLRHDPPFPTRRPHGGASCRHRGTSWADPRGRQRRALAVISPSCWAAAATPARSLHPELGEDARHMHARSLRADEQLRRDLLVRVADSHQAQYLHLPR